MDFFLSFFCKKRNNIDHVSSDEIKLTDDVDLPVASDKKEADETDEIVSEDTTIDKADIIEATPNEAQESEVVISEDTTVDKADMIESTPKEEEESDWVDAVMNSVIEKTERLADEMIATYEEDEAERLADEIKATIEEGEWVDAEMKTYEKGEEEWLTAKINAYQEAESDANEA